jgi:hypothetical protein
VNEAHIGAGGACVYMTICSWIRLTAILGAVSILTACGGDGDSGQHEPATARQQAPSGTADTMPPDAAAIADADAAASRTDLFFTTAQSIDALSYGLVGDGKTDNTAVFRQLLAGGNRTIHIPAGDYVTDQIELEANTALELEAGVTIRDAGRLGRLDRLVNIRTHDVRVTGLGARIVADRASYPTDEWRHGVYIYGADRVLIEGLEASGHGGDGFYIGGPPDHPSTDVQLRGCLADNNRRQGLSVTSAHRVQIIDCQFTNTNGTAPAFGIDLEPNASYDSIDHIILLRPQTTANAGGGILINLERLDPSSAPVDVTVLDHLSTGERVSLRTQVPDGVAATLRYGRSP